MGCGNAGPGANDQVIDLISHKYCRNNLDVGERLRTKVASSSKCIGIWICMDQRSLNSSANSNCSSTASFVFCKFCFRKNKIHSSEDLCGDGLNDLRNHPHLD